MRRFLFVHGCFEMVFFAVGILGTLGALYLIYVPVVGMTDIQTTRLVTPGKKDTYENVLGGQVKVFIKNTGNVAAKNVVMKLTWKIGKTSLPVTERPESKMNLLQGMTATQTLTFGKDVIERMINKERLIATYNFSYSDWIGIRNYSYPSSFEIEIAKKDPLIFAAFAISTP